MAKSKRKGAASAAKEIADAEHPQLPEMEDEKDEQLIRAAKRLLSIKTRITTATSEYQDAHENLLKLMHERNIDKYKYGKLVVKIDNKEKAKVTTEEESDEADSPERNGSE